MQEIPTCSQSISCSRSVVPEGHPSELPSLSVVVPVRNEERHLGALLDDLLAQEFPSDAYEIVVVDGESTDRTRELVYRYQRASMPRVLVLSNPKRQSSAGRNLGVQNSRGEVIVFIDGHCRIPNRRLLWDIAQIVKHTGADCLCRPQPLIAEGNSWFQDVVAHVRSTFLAHGRGSTIYLDNYEGVVEPMSSGAIYRRTVFSRIGPYDENFDACEDVEFNYRVHKAKLCSYFDYRLAVSYRPRASIVGLLKQTLRYGRGRFRFMRKHPEATTLSQLVPALFLAWLAAGALAAWVWPPLCWVFVAPVAGYGALVLSVSAWLALRHDWLYLLVAPWVYLTIHIGFGGGLWLEGVSLLLSRRPLREGSARSAP